MFFKKIDQNGKQTNNYLSNKHLLQKKLENVKNVLF